MLIFKQVLNTAKIKVKAQDDSHDNEFFIDYYLVKRMYNHRRQKICYGVGIEKYSMLGDSKQSLEQEEAENLSYDSDVIIQIIKKLYEGKVTPMTLLEVLDDIAEEIEYVTK
jgi:hypothetical protein